ncbi:MAG TPA: hypothetical protein VLA46_03525 [Saprospiraceae bacterium]|nr:hypothetical protein [Saprospiraceae bacterium]
MKKSYLILSHLLITALCIGFFSSAIAQGNLLIFPKRIVFEEGKKTEIINLTNTSSDTVRYSISFVQFRMDENGHFDRIAEPDPGQFFADEFLRYYPRTVTLGPNESQVVKLQLTKTTSLQPGEYRSHLYFRAEMPSDPLGEFNTPADTSSVSVRLIPVFGMTIPCIIRIGESSTDVEISNLTLAEGKDSQTNLQLEFQRKGNFSSYGDVMVTYKSANGKLIPVGYVRGVGIYAPGTIRKLTMALEGDRVLDFTEGELNVEYVSNSNKSKVLASARLSITQLITVRAN